MGWQVIGRKERKGKWHLLDGGLPCVEDAEYLATEYREKFGDSWEITTREDWSVAIIEENCTYEGGS